MVTAGGGWTPEPTFDSLWDENRRLAQEIRKLRSKLTLKDREISVLKHKLEGE